MKDVRIIYLVGFMGTGKTAIGRRLSKKLKWSLVDIDDEIVKTEGTSINDIFKNKGEDYFRNLETQTLEKTSKSENIVVSCGGGIVLKPQNIEIMKNSGIVILLTANPETIYDRVKRSKARPLLAGKVNMEHIKEMLDKREEFYAKSADITIKTDNKNLGRLVGEIVKALGGIN